jgi:hypothetical protein
MKAAVTGAFGYSGRYTSELARRLDRVAEYRSNGQAEQMRRTALGTDRHLGAK